MESQHLPVYYHPGSLLDVEIADGSGIRQYEVVRPITPFGTAQCLIVRERTPDHAVSDEVIILKVYDPRFMDDRVELKKDWDPESEAHAVEVRKAHPPPEPLTLHYVGGMRNRNPSLDVENYLFLEASCHYFNEVRAYNQLRPLQGKGIPRFLGHGTLSSTTVQKDPAPRHIQLKILLLEYIPNSVTLEDADVSILRPDLIRSLLDIVKTLQLYDVIHPNPHADNLLFAPDRALVIDFGRAIFREERNSDEEWASEARAWDDHNGAKTYLQRKLGTKSIDDYLNNVE